MVRPRMPRPLPGTRGLTSRMWRRPGRPWRRRSLIQSTPIRPARSSTFGGTLSPLCPRAEPAVRHGPRTRDGLSHPSFQPSLALCSVRRGGPTPTSSASSRPKFRDGSSFRSPRIRFHTFRSAVTARMSAPSGTGPQIAMDCVSVR